MHQVSENIYESFFINSVEGMIIFNTDGRIFNINATAKELFGFKKNETCPGIINELLDKKYQDELWKLCGYLIDRGAKSRGRNKLEIHEHMQNSCRDIILAMHLNNHIIAGHDHLISAVITDETLRWKEKHELKQSHERFRKVFKNNPVAQLIIREKDNVIIDTNNGFLKLFGYEADEITGKTLNQLGLDHCKECKNKICQNFSENQEDNNCETTAHTKNGTELILQQSYVHIMVHDTGHEVWTLLDITEQKKTDAELRTANEDLEQKVMERTRDLANLLDREKRMNELKSRFVATASHEFRTPLTSILVSAGLLEKYAHMQDLGKCMKHIDRIQSSVKLLTEILEDFLSLDKIEQGHIKSNVTWFNLDEFAGEVIMESEAILKKGQRIVYTTTGEKIIKQDQNLLKNTMLNLLSNACKYSGEGDIIDWKIEVQYEKTTITIADNGIGIPVEDQPYIFSRFFRAKNAETIQGTGLGLSIVKKYIELLHGKISFVSYEKTGTTFIIELPVLK